jgi:hypothetical protein
MNQPNLGGAMRHIRRHLTYANVMVTILAFVVLGGGTALAAYVVSSNSQIGPGTVSGHKPPSGKHANIIAGSINGTDIADRSGVDTCKTPLVAKYGPICAGADGGLRTWQQAVDYCTGFGLRLPSVSEAIALAKKFDVPGVSGTELFWTDEESENAGTLSAREVNDSGDGFFLRETLTNKTVCVTDPSA